MDSKAFVKEFYEKVVTYNQSDRIGDFVAADSVVRMGNYISPMGVDGMREHIAATKHTYPDYSMEIIKQYQDGEYVISEFIMTGTHEGEWLDITPTHKRLQFSGVDIDRVKNGKIVEHGGAVNTFDTLLKHNLIQGV